MNSYIEDINKESNMSIQVFYDEDKIVLKCQEIGLNTCWVAMAKDKNN